MAEGLLNRESPPLTTEVLQMPNSWKMLIQSLQKECDAMQLGIRL